MVQEETAFSQSTVALVKKGFAKEGTKPFWANVTVEPIMLFYLLAFFMANLTIQNLNLEKACRVNLNYSLDVCDALSSRNNSGFTELQQITVQKSVASVYIWRNVVHGIFPFILLPFLGSWSDRNQRRKACIMLPMIGEVFSCIMLLLCTYYFYELPMGANIIAESIPTAMTGGINAMFLGVYTYIAAHTSLEERTWRMGMVHLLFNFGLTSGFSLSGVIYQCLGFCGVFSLSCCLYLIGLVYGTFRLNEKNCVAESGQGVGFFRDFFELKNIKESLKVVFRRREGMKRIQIVLVLILAMLIAGPSYGELSVLYLYTIYKFQWNELDFSIFSTTSCVMNFLGSTFAITVFAKIFKCDDTVLGVVATISKISSCIVYALAPTPSIFYLGICLEFFSGVGSISLRSILSKLVPPEELGKANSALGMLESLMPLVYGGLYSALYKTTIKVFPGAFYLVGATMTVPASVIFLWLYNQQKSEQAEVVRVAEAYPLKPDIKE